MDAVPRAGQHKVTFHTIPKIVSKQGQEHEERTRERRTCWIAAISEGVLDSEQVCGHHFVSGRAAKDCDVHNIDWVPTLNLGEKKCKKPKETNAEAAKDRGERVKERRKPELERQEIELARRRKELTPTASSSSLDTNLNKKACGTSSDGGEETDKIFQPDKSTSTDDNEIRPEVTKKLKHRQKNSIISFQGLYIEHWTKIFLILRRQYAFTMVYHPMKSLL